MNGKTRSLFVQTVRSTQGSRPRKSVKGDFATEVVENSGNEPSEIIKNPAQVLELYYI